MDIEGKLVEHYETGMDGVAMAFEDFKGNGYDSLYPLKEGYYLKVYKNKKIFWEGKITNKMAELYSDFFDTGYKDKRWIKMFEDKMNAKLDLKGKEKFVPKTF